MSIDKITKLKIAEGFIQANYNKGHKYIDKAGEFLDSLYKDGEDVPKFQMTPQGAEIKISDMKYVRVNGENVWTKTVTPDTLEIQKQFATKVIKKAEELFTPTLFTRIGWRNYFIFDCNHDKIRYLNNERWLGGKLTRLSIERKVKNFDANISILPITNTEIEYKGILFDIDIYKRGDFEDSGKVVAELNKISDVFNSDDLLTMINEATV